MNSKDFLFEIGIEELPSASLLTLATALQNNILQALEDAKIPVGNSRYYVTPRRIAISISDVIAQQATQTIERQGPAADSAFDKSGTPTLACIGFARSCGVTADQLTIRETNKGRRVYCCVNKPGEATITLLPNIVKQALDKLPISKPMRWGNNEKSFVRPVHWLLALFGSDIINIEQYQLTASNKTYGHRFHHPEAIIINHPKEYAEQLQQQGYVIADFERRKQAILQQLKQQEKNHGVHIITDEALLNEVTALVEWPIVLIGKYPKKFLTIPAEVLVTSMKTHQKCFPISDEKNRLHPAFAMVSNISSSNTQAVIAGNERVINARLSDAAFFLSNDLSHSPSYFNQQLQYVVFQKSLGTLLERVNRISQLSEKIATQLQENSSDAKHAASLTKFDLVSEMVGEFPELQGIMGYYYAKNAQEPSHIANAIKEHYYPRFSGDRLPNDKLSAIIALADRLDVLCGIFGINKIPSGEKDPYGLRRCAQVIIRILVEKELPLDVNELLTITINNYQQTLENPTLLPQTQQFIMERMRFWYLEQGVSADIFAAVNANDTTMLLAFDQRLKAVQQFKTLAESDALIAANKRVSNLLKKTSIDINNNQLNPSLFESASEQQLATLLAEKYEIIKELHQKNNYKQVLSELATLKAPIDEFFDNVMVMVDDENIRNNRLALLTQFHQLFTQVADISLL